MLWVGNLAGSSIPTRQLAPCTASESSALTTEQKVYSLVQRSAAVWRCSACIHRVNWLNSRNDSES